ncbi:MAG: hypothetical protein ACRBDL_07325 [Alphaproteobacteria bacterium]
MTTFEKHMNYGDTRAYIRIPEEPTGLVFIAPGAQVDVNAPLITQIQKAAEDKGQATVIAALGGAKLNDTDPNNVHGNFVNGLQEVINGYMADNAYTPDEFEMIGHSMGATAVLAIAAEHPTSRITAIDPAPIDNDALADIHCPTDIIISNVRQYRAVGKRIHGEMQNNGQNPTINQIETSPDKPEGHLFSGQESQVAAIIRDQEPEQPDIELGRSTDSELFNAIETEDHDAPEA